MPTLFNRRIFDAGKSDPHSLRFAALPAILLMLAIQGGCPCSWPPPVANIITPADGGTVICECDSACLFDVQGTLSRTLELGEELFIAIRPVDEAAPRYFVQFGEKMVTETLWSAQAQIGSAEFPAQSEDVFEVQAIVVCTATSGPPPVGPLPDLTASSVPGLRSVSDVHVLSVTCDSAGGAGSSPGRTDGDGSGDGGGKDDDDVGTGDNGVLGALANKACWHLYSPYRERAGQEISESQLRRELQMLYDVDARGLVTYEMMNGVERAPRLAKEMGYEWVLAGIYWYTDGVANGQTGSTLEAEKAAIEQNIGWIDGIIIGNEGLIESEEWNQPRYTYQDLRRELRAMKAKHPGKLVTTAEGRDSYEQHPDLVSDPNLTGFIFPNLHPWWGGFRDPDQAVADLVGTIASEPFSERGDRLIVMHEAWWPSETEGQDEDAQYRFFEAMLGACIRFCWGETIDQPWKAGIEDGAGAHWGLWHYDLASDTYQPKHVLDLLTAVGCDRPADCSAPAQ